MTQKEKSLLLKDLSARLPYGVKVNTNRGPELMEGLWPFGFYDIKIEGNFDWSYLDFKPYLRSMSSMTEEEYKYCKEQFGITSILTIEGQRVTIMPMEASSMFIDWLNAHHFDYRGLIEKGLALKAPEGMYD